MMTRRSTSASRRKTIGIFAARVSRVWGPEFMAGITDAAEANDINVICFVGGKPSAIFTPGELKPSYGLYDLAKADQFAGLIFAADIGHNLKPDEIKRFCDNYASIPTVTTAMDVSGLPAIVTDNISGMRAMIRHLIEVHGYKRIAFIRGIKDQVDADQRFHAYKEELKAHKISFDEKLVVQGDFSPESGRAAVRVLLDERKVRFDAIAASNDRMAFGALELLQSRDINVPGDIALTGFDDVSEAESLGVPLTTVHQSFYDAGQKAVEALLQCIQGKSIPEKTVIPTEMVVRWSCGCLPEDVRAAVVEPEEVARTGRLENKRDVALSALLAAANATDDNSGIKQFNAVFADCWDSFLANLRGDSNSDAFLKCIETAVNTMQAYDRDASMWHNFISTLRRHALASITDPKVALHAENLFQQARLLAGEMAQRSQAYRRLIMEQQEEVLQSFSFTMAPAMSLKEIANAITKHFEGLGLERCYVMIYSDTTHPQSASIPPAENYRLLIQYDEDGLQMPELRPHLIPGRLTPEGKTPTNRRYTAVVMPLSLADNRFGFMWVELGTRDWEIYMRARNLLSSALLRTMLFEQREIAQHEVERLLGEARQRSAELAVAKERAERAYQNEQGRRHTAESLAKAARQLSSLLKMDEVPQQILEQLQQVVSYERGSLILDEAGVMRIVAHHGFPADPRVEELRLDIHEGDVYNRIVQTGEALIIDDVTKDPTWSQVEWLPMNHSWMGVPLLSKNKIIGMMSLTRPDAFSFSDEDVLLASTFAVQAAIALENARLYEESTRFNELMERMVSQRVEELNNAYTTLEKLDKNKTSFIQVAAHELRTPITVMKGYLGMLRGNPAIQETDVLLQAVDGVLKGTDRLHQIINAMLDVARLEGQTVIPRVELTLLNLVVKLVHREYKPDLAERNITLTIDNSIPELPMIMVDSQLIQKALDSIVVNAIKYTPDGGSITIGGSIVTDERLGRCVELRVRDTGIGIDPANQRVIFEKLHQIGKVELHSSGRTKFKGGGPGLGLAIAMGIVKAHGGKIWVESPGCDEEKLPGSTFFIRLPIPKE
jgi:DNA-binding LacI/PurR family transcriptional regulator/signal transduction histidine kinase